MAVVAKVLGYDIIVCEFELQSRYYIQTNTLKVGMNPLIILASA